VFRLGWEAEFMGRGRDRWPKSAGGRLDAMVLTRPPREAVCVV